MPTVDRLTSGARRRIGDVGCGFPPGTIRPQLAGGRRSSEAAARQPVVAADRTRLRFGGLRVLVERLVAQRKMATSSAIRITTHTLATAYPGQGVLDHP